MPEKQTTALLIGTTGMLAEAAREVIARADKAVLVSRRADEFLFGEPELDDKLVSLTLDYENTADFITEIEKHGPYDIALTWIRPKAELMRAALDAVIAPGGLLVEVMGSRSILLGQDGSPSIAETRAHALAAQPDITYAQVILGFVIEEDGSSRWLHHHEISAAATAQLDDPLPRRIAGTLEPWDKRPG